MAVRILPGSSRIRVANTKKSADAHRSKGWIFLPGIGSQEKLEIIAFKCCLFAIYRRDGFLLFSVPCRGTENWESSALVIRLRARLAVDCLCCIQASALKDLGARLNLDFSYPGVKT